MPRRERSSQSSRPAAPRPGAGWLGVVFGVAAGAALFLFAAPHVSLWIGRTLASAPPAQEQAQGATAVSAPIDWEGDAARAPPPPSASAPATPSPEDALKGRTDPVDPPAALLAPEDGAPAP